MRFAALAAVLAGLFTMHTIGLHGTSAPAASSTVVPGAHSDAVHGSVAPEARATAGHSCPECADSHAGMAGMCLSLLFAVAISLLLLRPRLFARWSLTPLRLRDARWLPSVTARPPRPPCLHVLCISRT
ncbi:DUF6153 family protein [Aeromicrobium halocynthiae]|uniref:DUF6153 family protein n=1 Tax=Aeromicrobium halocynthiae TaxID=560557 RepID=UPI0031DC4C3B